MISVYRAIRLDPPDSDFRKAATVVEPVVSVSYADPLEQGVVAVAEEAWRSPKRHGGRRRGMAVAEEASSSPRSARFAGLLADVVAAGGAEAVLADPIAADVCDLDGAGTRLGLLRDRW